MIDFDKDKYYFDEKAAKAFVYAIETNLVHPKGPLSGKPFLLEDWQKEDIIYPLFGIKSKETGLRRFRYAYIQIPKKNGKSPLAAAILVIILKYIQDSGAELVSLASSRDQAKIVFGDARKMLKKGSAFASSFKLYQNSIMVDEKSYKPLSADVGTNDGGNNNVVIVDELHRFKDRELVDLMEGSTAAKDDPITIMITTAGSRTDTICYEKYDYACKIRDGIIKDDTFLPVIYEALKTDDPFIEETWKKANPNYGVSVNKDFMRQQADKAKINKAYLNTFLRLHLNVWTAVGDVWIEDGKWLDCGQTLSNYDLIEKLKGEKCYGGLDLSSKSDITAFSLVFPPNEEREFEPTKYISINWFWLPSEKGRDSADKNNNDYLKWVADGWIEETEGNVIDYDYIEERILSICENFDLINCAYDPYNSVQIVAKLEEQGLKMEAFRQGFVSMNFPTLEFEVKINRKEFLHNNNPVLRWMVSNGVLLSDTGGKLHKVGKNTPHQKIDGLVTNIMALGLALNGEDNGEGSYLDESELIFVEI